MDEIAPFTEEDYQKALALGRRAKEQVNLISRSPMSDLDKLDPLTAHNFFQLRARMTDYLMAEASKFEKQHPGLKVVLRFEVEVRLWDDLDKERARRRLER